MDLLRTPDDRFAGLPDFPFRPNYVEVPTGDGGDLRIHYLDEGPRDGAVVVLMHGEPSWSFLYRRVIPSLVSAGLRCVAPDLVGFGRSDKPATQADHTYARHVEWMRAALFDRLGLERVTLLCQDWGGLIGLRLVGEHPERFARVVAANTFLPTGDEPASESFLQWQAYSQSAEVLPVGGIVSMGCATPLAPEVVAAYDAPFPDESYKAGVRCLPMLVPVRPDDPAAAANRNAWAALRRFERPFLCAFSDGDPITQGRDEVFLVEVPGAERVRPCVISGGGHFLQEDRPEELALAVVGLVRS